MKRAIGRNVFLFSFAALATLALCRSGAAQSQAQPQPPPPAKVQLPAKPSQSAVSSPFAIDGREKLVAFLNANLKTSVVKGQLDTTEEFKERRKNLARTFRATMGTSAAAALSYDADAAEMTIAWTAARLGIADLEKANNIIDESFGDMHFGGCCPPRLSR